MDEMESTEPRRSSRIIALEVKKQHEIEREIALELEKNNNSLNRDIRNKGKGKATKQVCDNLSDSREGDEDPIWKECKTEEIYQLMSSIKLTQESVGHSQNASTSGANAVDSSMGAGSLLKKILEFVIDFLQRKDEDDLFAMPINPNEAENYIKIVKQPMDFATIRAKLQEDFYSNLELFKRDIYLLCTNAMFAHPTTSKYHQVGEDIFKNAKWTFEAISANFKDFQSEFALNKPRLETKPPNMDQGTSRRVAPKPAGRKKASTPSVVAKKAKRNMYSPPNKPLVSEMLTAKNKPNIKLNKNPEEYKESVQRFVEDLGPTAQRVAAQKLEPLKDQPPENMSSHRHVQENADKGQWNTSSSIPNMSTIGSSSNAFARANPTRMISGPSTMLSGNTNSFSGLSLGPQSRVQSPLLRNTVSTSTNINNFSGLSLMPRSRVQYPSQRNIVPNINFPMLSLEQQSRAQYLSQRNPMSVINLPGLSLEQQSRTQYPSQRNLMPVINLPGLSLEQQSRAQYPSQRNPMPVNNLPGLSLQQQSRAQYPSQRNHMPVINLPGLSLEQQSRVQYPSQRNLMPVINLPGLSLGQQSRVQYPSLGNTIPDINLPRLSLEQQSRSRIHYLIPENTISNNNFSRLSLEQQSRVVYPPPPRNTMASINLQNLPLGQQSNSENLMSTMWSNNLPESSLVHQSRQRDSMNNMTTNDLVELPLMHQPWKEPNSPPAVEEAPPQLPQDNDDEPPDLDLRL